MDSEIRRLKESINDLKFIGPRLNNKARGILIYNAGG